MNESPVTLAELPLFPLNNVLFPGGSLPLQIFEPRYLDMVARREASGEPFGVVCLSEGREVRLPGGDGFARERLHPLGTLARIDTLQRPQPGLLLIECTGTQRFRIVRSVQGKFGLWVADVELLADDAVVDVPADLVFVGTALQQLLTQVEPGPAPAPSEAVLTLPEPHRWDDCGWLANRWCELLPLEAAQKQRLLALESPVLRLELVADALGQMGLAPGG